jgi:hypothetical protein
MARAVQRYPQYLAMVAWNATVVSKGGADSNLPSPASFAAHPIPPRGPRGTSGFLRSIVAQALALGATGMLVSDIPPVVDDRRFGELRAQLDALISGL